MVFGLDSLGFGSKRRWALQLLDRSLSELEVNPGYLDDGMKYIIYDWALEEERRSSGADGALDSTIRNAAALISFCILGKEETGELWGAAISAARSARFEAVLQRGEDETLDARLIKLVLAKGLAAPDIRAQVELD